MSIQQDNTWPDILLDVFNHTRTKRPAKANSYYGAYNALLNYSFEPGKYLVAPRKTVRDGSDLPIGDILVYFTVYKNNEHPVLVVDVKDDDWVESAQLRYRADELMRQHFDLLLDDCPIPRLWGLSLLGTSMRVYCANKETRDVSPTSVAPPKSAKALPPDLFEGEWKLDIMSQEGFNKVKEIVDDICANK